MSRLIDADKLRINCVCVNGICVDGRTIENAPTVKAIPIEWMKKFANERALNDGMDGYWHFWGTDLLQMIELWEKENEID